MFLIDQVAPMSKTFTPYSQFATTIGSLVLVAVCSLPVAFRVVANSQQKPVYRHTGAEGSVSGTIAYAGQPPPRAKIDMSADAICFQSNKNARAEHVVVTDGRLANVFVYVKSGAAVDNFTFGVPATPVVVDQSGCRFVPRVVGLQAGQSLAVLNSDPTNHNVHPVPIKNPEWNQSQPPQGTPIEKRFNQPEIMIPIKCNQHPWMKAWVGVLNHPFFAVSARDGSYRIEGLPPGDYTIAIWHEVLGEQTTSVFIAGREDKTLNFTVKSPVGEGASKRDSREVAVR